jgi:hypothetical protein
MKLWSWITRAVRVCDNLCEVLIFDLLLGTRTGRRVLGMLTLTVAAVVYLLSGLIFGPAPYARPIVDGAPYINGHPDFLLQPMVVRTLKAHQVAPTDEKPLRFWLETNRVVLDRAIQQVNQPHPPPFIREPNLREVREMAEVLAVRAEYALAHGRPGDALTDLIGTMRLGRVLAFTSPADQYTCRMIGVSCERRAMLTLLHHARAGAFSPLEARQILEDLTRRRVDWVPLTTTLEAYRAECLQMVTRYERDGSWRECTGDPNSSMVRITFPSRAEDRIEAARELEARIRDRFDQLIAAARAWQPPATGETPVDTTADVPSHGPWEEVIRGLISKDYRMRVAAELVAPVSYINIHHTMLRLHRLELEAAELSALARCALTGAPTSSVTPLPPPNWQKK